MKNRTAIISIILLAILLTGSVVYNFIQSNKITLLEGRIEKFIPAAQEIETENARLQEQAKTLQEKIYDLEHPATPKTETVVPQILPPLIPEQMQAQPPASDFRDLNKKEGL